MSQLALDGLRAERAATLDVLRSLRADEWNAPSAEAGLRVRDVVGHVASTHHGVIDRAHLPGNGDPVAARREWRTADLVDEFETYTDQTANVFAAMQNGSGAREVAMGAFGTHLSSQLADLYLFDLYGHLRGDILRPYGPVDRPEPPRDEMRVRPTVEWMVAAWPCMCPMPGVGDPLIVLTLDGPGGGTWTIGAPTSPVGATVRSNDHDFTLWGTQRRPWRDFVTIDGDETYAARVLDTVRII
jgi:uncharacterized protein (TIGR03083 family)